MRRQHRPQTRTKASGLDKDGPILKIGDSIAVADTAYGKVRGYVLRDIHYFLGVPYGADTSGANRFMPPQKPKPWTDIRPTLWWGNTAPQNMDNRYASQYGSFRDHWNYDDVSEDCLRLNVFTPALKDGKKRPVMFWIHGGGYTNGNAIEHDGYNGENLARSGDVVFVSINHRLGPLGYCNLAGVGGEKYSASGNVGQLDIVAALEWVRDNIANFGGDPGQRHDHGPVGRRREGVRAVGDAVGQRPVPQGRRAERRLGAGRRQGHGREARELRARRSRTAGRRASTSCSRCRGSSTYEIATKAQRKLAQELAAAGTAPGGLRAGFSPSVDGTILPQHPFAPEPAPTAANVPMIICSVENEQAPAWTDASLMNITLPEVAEKLKQRAGFGPGLGDKAMDVVTAYAKAYPDKKPVEIWSLVSSNRSSVVTLADSKSKQPAPVFVTLVRVAAAALRRPHRRVPLRGHLLLVQQHRPDVHPHRRRRPAAQAGREDVEVARPVHEDGRSERRRPHAVVEVHVGQWRDARARRRLRDEERPRSGAAQGAAGNDVRRGREGGHRASCSSTHHRRRRWRR